MKYVLLVLFVPIALYAQTQNAPVTQKPDAQVFLPKVQDLGNLEGAADYSVMRSFVFPFVLLLCFLLCVYFVAQWLRKKKLFSVAEEENPALSRIAFLTVAPSKSVQLLRVGEKVYVLGVADASISVIDSIENPEEVQNLINLAARVSPVDKKEFFEVFKQFFHRNGSVHSSQ